MPSCCYGAKAFGTVNFRQLLFIDRIPTIFRIEDGKNINDALPEKGMILRAIEDGNFIKIDWEPESFYNSKEYFKEISKLYKDDGIDGNSQSHVLKYHESMALLEEIEEEIRREEQEDDFF